MLDKLSISGNKILQCTGRAFLQTKALTALVLDFLFKEACIVEQPVKQRWRWSRGQDCLLSSTIKIMSLL